MALQKQSFFCVYKLRNKIIIFLKNNQVLAITIQDSVFQAVVIYCISWHPRDIFEKLNQLNILGKEYSRNSQYEFKSLPG